MLGHVPYPYPKGRAEAWIARQSTARRTGVAYRFAIEFEGALVGVVSIERQENGDHMLGYWLGEPYWGQDLMSEAVRRIIRFARETLVLTKLVADYFTDNPASGRVLEKCGFRVTGHGLLPSLARGGDADGVYVVLHLAGADGSNTVA